MVTLILADNAKVQSEMPKFEQILAAWDLQVIEQTKQDDKIRVVINARYYSQANLVLAIARNNFNEMLLTQEADYQADPPNRK